jgi:Mg2+ and Co2+ transporter CorA
LHNHCFLPKREAQKLAFAHFNNLKQNFRWRPQFTDQRQQISHLLPVASFWRQQIKLENPPCFWLHLLMPSTSSSYILAQCLGLSYDVIVSIMNDVIKTNVFAGK